MLRRNSVSYWDSLESLANGLFDLFPANIVKKLSHDKKIQEMLKLMSSGLNEDNINNKVREANEIMNPTAGPRW